MSTHINLQVPSDTSVQSLIKGFILTKQTEGKSPRTVEFYRDNLRRFLWYAVNQKWPDDIRLLTEWHFREFLAYIANEPNGWGIAGNGSETSKSRATHSTVHHYFVVLSTFFNWAMREGFINTNPLTKIKIAKPKPKVITPYSIDEITRILKAGLYI